MACQAKRWCAREHEYRQTNAGKHWRQYVDYCRRWLPFAQLHKLLRQTIESKVSNGITVENITVEYAERAAIVARHPVILAREQAKFVVSADVIIGALRALAGKSRGYTGSECQGRYQVLYKGTLEQNAANVESLLAEFKLLEGAMKISARSEILSCALLLGDGLPTNIPRCMVRRGSSWPKLWFHVSMQRSWSSTMKSKPCCGNGRQVLVNMFEV
ncbi:hypothetical protein AFCA_013135 [Aspergillus flavus]|nr:hypothetical protein AFCA_013135 [Aspergillus flavus]